MPVTDMPQFDGCGLCDADLENDLELDTGVCDDCGEYGGDWR